MIFWGGPQRTSSFLEIWHFCAINMSVQWTGKAVWKKWTIGGGGCAHVWLCFSKWIINPVWPPSLHFFRRYKDTDETVLDNVCNWDICFVYNVWRYKGPGPAYCGTWAAKTKFSLMWLYQVSPSAQHAHSQYIPPPSSKSLRKRGPEVQQLLVVCGGMSCRDKM